MAFVAPYLAPIDEAAPQRGAPLREVFDGLRSIVRTGLQRRAMPHDLPPWAAVHQQTPAVTDGRGVRGCAAGGPRGAPRPTAAIFDSRIVQSTPESGGRAGGNDYERRKGGTVHPAVDALGHVLALRVAPAIEQDRVQVAGLASAVRDATGQAVEVASVDRGGTGAASAADAAACGIRPEVVRLPGAECGFVLLPRRGVVERSFAWASRFRRLVREDERWPSTPEGPHFFAFACLTLQKLVGAAAQSP